MAFRFKESEHWTKEQKTLGLWAEHLGRAGGGEAGFLVPG